MKHIDRTGLYLLVIICIMNTCGVESEHKQIQRDLDATQNQLKYAIHLLEGGEPRTVTELDCSRSTDKIIDCRPMKESNANTN